ncbi:hypothetical protein [Nonomuraea sp. NPDC005650]|uniref:hypothetical protein n=1 Tax=Nonomuraea sp. NPDC005650 TaxID=3157045 RepID=UPI0033BD00EF
MIFRTFQAHHGILVTCAWDATHQTFYTRGTSPHGRKLWEDASGMPTLLLLRAALLGHRIALPGREAEHLLHDRKTANHSASRTASGYRNGCP